MATTEQSILKFKYKNYKGEIANREVIPMSIVFGKSKHHPDKEQWLLEAMDINKKAVRLFSIIDIIEFYK